MRRVAGSALSVAAAFLSLMAILIDAPALFYMSFALIATLIASNVQAGLAAKGLEIHRVVPQTVVAGESATIELTLHSLRRIRRPLVTVQDALPASMSAVDVTPSLPVAPAFDQPVRTQYRFRPLKRGVYRISRTYVTATDALGLVLRTVPHDTEIAELIVTPRPLPIEIELPSGGGLGASEATSGSVRGAGIEPRGIREYAPGDALRYVDWRSSARTNRLQVKEFEAGTHGNVVMVLQRHPALDREGVVFSAFDAMLGHALALAARLERQGVRVAFPGIGLDDAPRSAEARGDWNDSLARALARLRPIASDFADDVQAALATAPVGATLVLFAGIADGVPEAVRAARSSMPAVLTYDPRLYDPALPSRAICASEICDELRRAGATVIEAPAIDVVAVLR